MAVPWFLTVETCHARQQLDERKRTLVDRAVLGLSLVPSLGSYDADSDARWYAAGGEVLLQYRVLSTPEPQIVVVHIGTMDEMPAAQEKRPLAVVR